MWADQAVLPNTQALTTVFKNVGNDAHIQIKTSSANTYTNPLRIYANTTITIKAVEGYKIESVTYEASSTGNYVTYAQNATVVPNVTPTVSDKNVTWSFTGEVSEFTFTPSSQTRCNSITITYSASGSTTNACATPTFNPEAGAYTSAQKVEISTTTDGATIYYTTDGTDPTTNSNAYTAAITVSTTTTIKAIAVKDGMVNSSVAIATYTFTEHAGTKADPYTVADARAAIDAGTGVNGVYVKGTVSKIVEEYDSQYGNISYNISSDGTTTADQLEAFRGKSYNGENFTSADDIQVGDEVVVYGNLVKYNSTYELAQDNQLVSWKRGQGPAVINVSDAQVVAFGDIYTLNQDDIKGGNITVTSSNTAVATVDGLVITPVAVGTTTITIETEENEYYYAGSAKFTLTVTAPEGSAAAPSGDALFNETFDKLDGTGGRDNAFTGNIGTSSTTDKLDETWAVIGKNGANKCIKLGTGSAEGTVTTGNIALTGNGTLTFSAAGWGTGENTITVVATGAELSGDTEVTLTNGEWKNYTVSITGATGEVAITFTMKRGFLDDVKVVAEGSLPTAPTVTLAVSGYASYCCEYPLDLDQLDNDNVKAYIVTDVNGEDVTFTQLTGKIKGGVPFILYGTPNFKCQLTYTESDVVPSGNMLVGTLAPTYVTAGNIYGLSGGQFKKINTGVMKANKAYLATTSSAPALNIIFDEDGATGIRSIDNGQLTIDNVYYDLSGRRIEKPTKGLYIVNGKKVILK